ncbi:MAG: hypothetical protein UT39_C0012G0022 [Candidatus Woesebacteria bacterium GW2011_GWA1_39_21]|uniref:Uncharacterized protein n=1 Tax=Candidatus Woesebacteria bacterium GW2011_GWA1_39_21 TaxID=1618550 RepID=A0A0G0QKR8_9BACT|nr:MAG: hypothetical protein UT39_C0012G0022 [Candidatus Woesebacteria bacterium GW2011_GWA1_39_21]
MEFGRVGRNKIFKLNLVSYVQTELSFAFDKILSFAFDKILSFAFDKILSFAYMSSSLGKPRLLRRGGCH